MLFFGAGITGKIKCSEEGLWPSLGGVLGQREAGFCGSQCADHIPPASKEAPGLMSTPAAILPKLWTRLRRVGAKPSRAEKTKLLGCPQGPHVLGVCSVLRPPPPASQHDYISKMGISSNPPPQKLPSLSILPCGSSAKRLSPAVSLRLHTSPARSPS